MTDILSSNNDSSFIQNYSIESTDEIKTNGNGETNGTKATKGTKRRSKAHEDDQMKNDQNNQNNQDQANHSGQLEEANDEGHENNIHNNNTNNSFAAPATKSRKTNKSEINHSNQQTKIRLPGQVDGCPQAVESIYEDRYVQPLFVLRTDEPKLLAQCFKHILDVKFIKAGKIRMSMYKSETTHSQLNGWVMRLTCMNSLGNGGAGIELMPLVWNQAACQRPLAINFAVMRIKQAMEFHKQFGNAPVRLTWVLTQKFENFIYAENMDTGKFMIDRFYCTEEANVEEEFNPFEFHINLIDEGMFPKRNRMFVSDFVKTVSAMHERRSDDNRMVMKWTNDSLQFTCNTGSVNIPRSTGVKPEGTNDQENEQNKEVTISSDTEAKFNIVTLNDLCDLFLKEVKDSGDITNSSHFINMSLFPDAALILRQTVTTSAGDQNEMNSQTSQINQLNQTSQSNQVVLLRIAAVQSVMQETV